jgi:hypothetical protein
MAIQYVSIPHGDLGGGIDQLSPENKLAEGKSEFLVNTDPKPEGYLVKRTGYQGHGGQLPVRVSKIKYTSDATNNICFFFDSAIDISSIDLSSLRSTPVVVYGRTAEAQAGDFTNTDSVHYYSGFTADERRVFQTGSNSFSAVEALGTQHTWVFTSQSSNVTSNDNEIIGVDTISLDKVTGNVTIDYNNQSGSSFNGFLYYKDVTPTPGSSYWGSNVGSNLTFTVPVGTTTFSIPASTHSLDNFNIGVRVFKDNTTAWEEITPDIVVLNTDGSIDITLTNNDASSFDAIASLITFPVTQFVTGTVPGIASAPNNTATITIPGLTTDFLSCVVYLEQTLGGAREQVLPDTITIDSATKTATLTFTNTTTADANFYVFWESLVLTSNKLCVTGATITGGQQYEDDLPQLTIWGLDHTLIYGENTGSSRPGWVTHIDSYRSVGETRLVSGLGGNLFDLRERSEIATDYLVPLLYPNLRGRVATTTDMGPAFFDATDSPTRTRGYVQFSGGGEGWAQVTDITWVSGNQVKYTLNCPNLSITGTLSSIIDSSDQLTVEQAGYSVNNGIFDVISVSNPSTDVIEVVIENTERDSADFDETDCGAEAGVFTDRVTLLATSPFIEGDTISASTFTESTSIACLASSGTTLFISGVTERINLPSGLRLTGARTSSVIPLRELDETASVQYVVRGDMLAYLGTERELKVKYVHADSDRALTIDADGQVATATLGSGDTTSLWVGQKVLIIQAGAASGVHTITDIPSGDSFTFDLAESLSGQAGTLLGKTVQIDEEFSWEDSSDSTITVQVARRWIPVEAPDDSFDLTPGTHYRYLDTNNYGDQPYLRSVMVADNMYFTNGDDEVYKYDGTSIYRAGLIRWQPQAFVTLDTSPSTGGTITLNLPTTTPSAVNQNVFTVPIGDELKFRIGQTIRHANTSGFEDYLIENIYDDGTGGFIQVQTSTTITLGTSPSLTRVALYKYYFRLNAVDANQNVVASAVTGLDDFNVQVAQSTQVRIRLTGLPAWDVYDYSRLEVQIYRTKLNGVAPFYRLTSLPLSFNSDDGYIDYIDTDADDVLRDLDEVNTALLGAEVGLAWEAPLRAKYITSAGNRLVLGNLKDNPRLDIQVVDTGTRLTKSSFNGQRWLFRKDNTDVGTSTDMLSRAGYQLRNAGAVTITPNTDIATTAGTDFTITSAAHGLVAGDWVYLFRNVVADGTEVRFAGWWQVASADATTFTINYSGAPAAATADDVNRFLPATLSGDIPVWIGEDGNLGMFNGNIDDTVFPYEGVTVRRLAMAINASMRKVDTTIADFEGFVPWMIAEAGASFQFGQLVVSQPKAVDTFLEVQLPTFSGMNIFVNQVKRTTGAQASAQVKLLPSRIIVSYPNYPEIFDAPLATVDSQSVSAIDVNPADGQEITGIIPFFGESAFGAALQDGVVVVFKTNSIYLVNLAAKAAGQNAVQKIESQGLGCTAPYTIAPSRNGIMFANESGIYMLGRDMQITYKGRYLERYWRNSVDRSRLPEMTGHYYSNGNQYKLSCPEKTDSQNDKVLVYDTVREYTADGFREGSWTTYDNHPAIGWANLETDAFFASTKGEVYLLRRTGLVSDFRDDSEAISMVATLRAMDFGDAAIRKAIAHIMVQYRTIADAGGIGFLTAADLTEAFEAADQVEISLPQDNEDGLSDDAAVKVATIRYSIDRRKLSYVQVQVTDSNIDEPVEVAAITYRVGGMNEKGTTQAASTSK